MTISDIERGRNRGSRELLALAAALSTEPGYLATGRAHDKPHRSGNSTSPNGLVVNSHHPLVLGDKLEQNRSASILRIEVLDKGAAGLESLEATAISALEVRRSWLPGNLPDLKPGSRVVLTTALDDAMAPTFSRGDILIMDLSVNEFVGDGVYAFTLKTAYFVRRIQHLADGSVRVIADQRALYEPYMIAEKDLARARVLGRVLYTWGGRRL